MRSRLKFLILLNVLILICRPSLAQEQVKPDSAVLDLNQAQPTALLNSTSQKEKSIDLSADDLLANPKILSNFLDKAIESQSWDMATHLLELYKRVSDAYIDTTLLSYAQARLAHAQGHYKNAISLYQQILLKQPELTPIRLYLAQSLFENHQDKAAKHQFEIILTQQIPKEVNQQVNEYLQAIG